MLMAACAFIAKVCFSCLQTEIAKRLNAIIAQVLPFLAQEVSFQTPVSF
jgi:hypothetical protein